MKYISVLLSILLFVSCGNKQQAVEEIVIVYEKLDSNLVKGVLELIETGQFLRYPEIPLDESFIIMLFSIDEVRTRSSIDMQRKITYLDSNVVILHFNYYFATDNELIDYKGMLNIEGYNVAIYEAIQDLNSFGHNFYNVDSLQQIPLDNFKRYPMKNFRNIRFRVQNDSLINIGNWSTITDPENRYGEDDD